MVFGEVFEEEAEFAKGFDGEEVGVVDDWNELFAFEVEGAGFGDETAFAFVVAAVGFEFEGLAKEAQDVVPAVEGAVDDGGEPLFGVVVHEVVFEDAFAGAGFADDEAEAALVGVNFEDFHVALLVREEVGFCVDDEGVFGETEVGSDHFY